MTKTGNKSCKNRKDVTRHLAVFGFVRLQKPSSSSTRMTPTGCELGHLSSVRNTLHILCSLTQSVQLPINAHGVRRFNRLPFKGYHFFQTFVHVILHKEDRVGTIHPVRLVKNMQSSKSQQQKFSVVSSGLTLPRRYKL